MNPEDKLASNSASEQNDGCSRKLARELKKSRTCRTLQKKTSAKTSTSRLPFTPNLQFPSYKFQKKANALTSVEFAVSIFQTLPHSSPRELVYKENSYPQSLSPSTSFAEPPSSPTRVSSCEDLSFSPSLRVQVDAAWKQHRTVLWNRSNFSLSRFRVCTRAALGRFVV